MFYTLLYIAIIIAIALLIFFVVLVLILQKDRYKDIDGILQFFVDKMKENKFRLFLFGNIVNR